MGSRTIAFAFAAALAAALAGPILPASAQTAGERLERGIIAHNASAAGDGPSIDEALRLLGPEGWERPPLALAYHGSALTLDASRASKAGRLARALALIDEGTKEMDRAVALAPGDPEARILRLENSVALLESSPAERGAEADADIAYLRSRGGALKAEERALVELDSGRLALARKKLGEALASWRRAAALAPDSEPAARARKLLARYED